MNCTTMENELWFLNSRFLQTFPLHAPSHTDLDAKHSPRNLHPNLLLSNPLNRHKPIRRAIRTPTILHHISRTHITGNYRPKGCRLRNRSVCFARAVIPMIMCDVLPEYIRGLLTEHILVCRMIVSIVLQTEFSCFYGAKRGCL